VVDGGWRQWTAEGRFTTTAIPKIESTIYPVAESTAATRTQGSLPVLKLGINGWKWKSALDRNGFREYDELARLAKNAGLRPGTAFRVEDPDRELGHLALMLELLGNDLNYDSRASVLSLSSR